MSFRNHRKFCGLWKIGAKVVTNMFPIPNVEKSFDSNGKALEKASMDKLAKAFVVELLESIEVKKETVTH